MNYENTRRNQPEYISTLLRARVVQVHKRVPYKCNNCPACIQRTSRKIRLHLCDIWGSHSGAAED